MIGRTNIHLKKRVLLVDDDLANPASARGRVLSELVEEFHHRNTDVVSASSYEDGMASVVSDAALHCICVDWTLGRNDTESHAQALELLRSIRQRHERVPVFLMADRDAKRSITVEAMELADEFTWMLEDTASFVAGRVVAAIERYLEHLMPPFTDALIRYTLKEEHSWAAPGHQGGIAFTKSPIGRVFFDFFGENLFRADSGIERGNLGSVLDHSGPVGESEAYAARIFGAHLSYAVLNGTSGSNRTIFMACVGENQFALCDRNCHKSIEQGLVLCGGLPVYMTPTRNRFGIIGPLLPEQFDPQRIAAAIASHPLRAQAQGDTAGLCGADQLHLRRHVPECRTRRGPAGAEQRPYPLRRGLVRLCALQSAVPRALRHARRSARTPRRCADGVRHPLHPQAAGGAVAILVHPYPQRPQPDRAQPFQRILRDPGQHLAALPDVRLQRGGRGDDGRQRRLQPDPGCDSRSGGLPPGAGARASRVRQPRRLVLPAVERAPRCATASGTWVDFVDADAELLATDPACWELEPGAQWHGFAGLEEGWCLLDPIKVGIMVPGMGDDGTLEAEGIPAPVLGAFFYRNNIVPSRITDFMVLCLFSIGVTKGKWATLINVMLAFKRHYDCNLSLERVLPDLVATYPARYSGMGLRDLSREMFEHMRSSRMDSLQAEAFGQLPPIERSPRAAFQALQAGAAELLPLTQAANRVTGVGVMPYPPGIPIVMPGENLGPLDGPWLRYIGALQDWGNRFPGFEKEVSGAVHKDGDYHFWCLK